MGQGNKHWFFWAQKPLTGKNLYLSNIVRDQHMAQPLCGFKPHWPWTKPARVLRYQPNHSQNTLHNHLQMRLNATIGTHFVGYRCSQYSFFHKFQDVSSRWVAKFAKMCRSPPSFRWSRHEQFGRNGLFSQRLGLSANTIPLKCSDWSLLFPSSNELYF